MATNVKTILSLDGGGIRGVIPARILMEIEKQTGKTVPELFDYVTGTSTGGILALCLTKPGPDGKPALTASHILEMYREHGQHIFSSSFWHKVASLGNLNGPKYTASGIESVLQQYLGDATLPQALSRVLIPTFSIDQRQPVFFKSWNLDDSAADDVPMWQVARATSAAPTYFPPFQMDVAGSPRTLIDGGVVANTPAMCMYADAQRSEPAGTQFRVLSLGTGTGTGTIDPKKAAGWGGLGWVSPLLDILLDGSAVTTDYELRHILDQAGHEYMRVQIMMAGAGTAMDDVSTIDSLVKSAEEVLDSQKDALQQFFR